MMVFGKFSSLFIFIGNANIIHWLYLYQYTGQIYVDLNVLTVKIFWSVTIKETGYDDD